jgi:hypothetical protein
MFGRDMGLVILSVMVIVIILIALTVLWGR